MSRFEDIATHAVPALGAAALRSLADAGSMGMAGTGTGSGW